MRILFTAGPAYGLTLPIIPLVWAARAAGHEVLVASTSGLATVCADAGLPVADVFPDHDLWDRTMAHMTLGDKKVGTDFPDSGKSAAWTELHRTAAAAGGPFGMFTTLMTEGTIAAAREFEADLVVHTTDHPTGALAARALDIPALDVGNRVSWSNRDATEDRILSIVPEEIRRGVRELLDIPDGEPTVLARIDPRVPSMGGIETDQVDTADGVPWWPMRYVPFNGGAVVPEWARTRPDRPRIGVTLGTVVPIVAGTSSLTVVIDALAELDVEVVLAAGTTDLTSLGTLPDNVRSVGYLALSAFLPTCSLLVHHGGSGTTAAPLYYGVPQLVLPSFADNPMSAERVVARGVGLSHDPSTVDAETARKLVERLLSEPEFADAASAVAAEIATQPSPASVIERVAETLPG